ncbi:hypothetical protein K435DRAFT_856530 [Dendrothele bispora CBS 962.96]|uniref:Uncharacterized protein n=1 Tax=Dendrothele bispora (strain CBS 962.96) TaxID=1314807 RepID=A0A4S8M8K6_DENBC|nr:hypothetical protein K435DRAFT_856530 [Dendrothele bispora CBS 962.96]
MDISEYHDLSQDDIDEIDADPLANDDEFLLPEEFDENDEEDLKKLDGTVGLTQQLINEVAAEKGHLLMKWKCKDPKVLKADEKKRKAQEYQHDRRAQIKAQKAALKATPSQDRDKLDPAPTPKRLKTTDRSSSKPPPTDKQLTPDFLQRGPFEFKTTDTYDHFLNLLAQALPCIPSQLPLPTIIYRPQKGPAGCDLPLGGPIGYGALIKEFKHHNKKQGLTMILMMDPPSKAPEELVFWETGDIETDQAPSFDYSALEVPDTVTSMLFDAKNAPILARLHETYPVSNNPLYPDMAVYTSTDRLSWELNDMRFTVWASHIVSHINFLYQPILIAKRAQNTCGVDYEKPPLNTITFDFTKRLRPPKPAPPLQLYSRPLPLPLLEPKDSTTMTHERLMDLMLLNVIQQQQQHFSMPVNVPPAPLTSISKAPTANTSAPSSVPSLPGKGIKPVCVALSTFCKYYRVLDKNKECFETLEYVPGNCAIEKLPRDEWSVAGFTTLSWSDVISTHCQFLNNVKSGVWVKGTMELL